eukprot:4333773-Pyramimonas_sp.AAC.1
MGLMIPIASLLWGSPPRAPGEGQKGSKRPQGEPKRAPREPEEAPEMPKMPPHTNSQIWES